MRRYFPFIVLLVYALTGAASADVTLPALFADHMVLQRDMAVPVWGWALPGEEVRVQYEVSLQGIEGKAVDILTEAPIKVTTTAGADGKWSLKLPPLHASANPHTLVIQGKNKITIQDVLVGEVWVGSGQSNMEYGLNGTPDLAATIAAAKPEVRLFISQGSYAHWPSTDVPHSPWMTTPAANPGFSAVLYHMGRSLHEQLKVPIGLIESNVGGTPIQAWTPREAYDADPALKNELNWLNATESSWENAKAATFAAFESWLAISKQNHAEGKPIPPAPVLPPDPMLASGANPTVLYNGKIAPLIPYAIRGVVWYQGEANAAEGMLYASRLKAMIASWRKIWGEGDFPFGIVQLASFNYGEPTILPRLWEAQTTVADHFPNCGMAVITDVSTFSNIHPPNKKPVGERLALWAMATVYGKKDLEYSGPRFESFTVEGDKVRIKFTHVGKGLASRDDKPLTWFALAGADKKFVIATATIDGDTIVVHADGVTAPTAVQFAWNNAAQPNLMNKEGLPAPAFRTDGP